MINFTIECTGTSPLLMHNGRLADPLDPLAKAVGRLTKKRTKTDDDYRELGRCEYLGGLYLDPDVGPYIPGDNITRCLLDAAKITRQGTALTRAMLITTSVNPLVYGGPRDAEQLWDDPNFQHVAMAVVGGRKVRRTRPCFRQWAVQAEGVLDTAQLELADLAAIADTAGQMIGLGDWRPGRSGTFGRFQAKVAAA